MTTEPAAEPLATVHPIHPLLVKRYETAYTQGYLQIMNTHEGEDLDMLHIIREEVTADPGRMGVDERGLMRGRLEALGELIYRKTMEER